MPPSDIDTHPRMHSESEANPAASETDKDGKALEMKGDGMEGRTPTPRTTAQFSRQLKRGRPRAKKPVAFAPCSFDFSRVTSHRGLKEDKQLTRPRPRPSETEAPPAKVIGYNFRASWGSSTASVILHCGPAAAAGVPSFTRCQASTCEERSRDRGPGASKTQRGCGLGDSPRGSRPPSAAVRHVRLPGLLGSL